MHSSQIARDNQQLRQELFELIRSNKALQQREAMLATQQRVRHQPPRTGLSCIAATHAAVRAQRQPGRQARAPRLRRLLLIAQVLTPALRWQTQQQTHG